MNNAALIPDAIRAYLNDPSSSDPVESVISAGLDGLPLLVDELRQDAPIDRTESLEALYKRVLHSLLSRPLTGPEARAVALAQQRLGFVLKYKSYAVKAATPLGYSIFLQSPREGFSFQHHIVHKLEVFHIVAVPPGGFVFLCDYKDWESAYEPSAFAAWLDGAPNQAYDRFRFVPEPGDVFVISELGIVHTVVGCILEEYATVSTDMVKRLHDQNAGHAIPARFTRANAERALLAIEPPAHNRIVHGFAARQIEPLLPVSVPGGECTVLCDSFLKAARYRIQPHAGSALICEPERAVMLRFARGHGSVVLADSSELAVRPSLEFGPGDLMIVAPGIHYAVLNASGEVCEFSEQCIAPDVAFV